MKKTIPLYELKIDPEQESFVDAIALVEQPAIETDFIAFSKQDVKELFAINDEKMELIGPSMIPNVQIFRRGPEGDYNVFFSAVTIREIAQVFMKKGLQSNLNLDHTVTPAHSFVYQSYITDKERGINAPKGIDVPDGSWIIGVKVEDPEVWADIKAGKRKGFSVEGLFQFFEPVQKHDKTLEDDSLELFSRLKALLQGKSDEKSILEFLQDFNNSLQNKQ